MIPIRHIGTPADGCDFYRETEEIKGTVAAAAVAIMTALGWRYHY